MTIKIVVKNENKDAGSASETFTFDDLLISIGSGDEVLLRLDGDKIALEQAVIINENGCPLLINQGQGTILNDQEIRQGLPHELKSGDRVRIGSYHLIVELDENLLTEVTEENASEEFLLEEKLNGNDQSYFSDLDENLFSGALTPDASKNGAGSFADILSSLRKDEDQFYFQVVERDGARRRILVELDETILGWDAANGFLSANKGVDLEQPQAVIRKDWNGVTIYPNGNEAILLNDALLEVGSRLKNNDKLIFSRRTAETGMQSVKLVFCEPAALVELNAILPQQLVSSALETNHKGEITVDPGLRTQPPPENLQNTIVEAQAMPIEKKNSFYFGYFMPAEIIVMIVATILTAVLTFILLEFS